MIMVTETTTALLIRPAIAFGLIIGLYELFLIHADENFRGSHWFGHGLQSVILAIIAVFITMNTAYFLSVTGLDKMGIPFISNYYLVNLAVALIFGIKVYSVSAVVKGAGGRGMHEKWYHVLIVAVLVYVSPIIYQYTQAFLPPIITG